MLWVFVFCIQRSWPVLWSLGVWFCLDASLLPSGYDHRWYGATQQAIYVASVEGKAYIGGKWVPTAMWPLMMHTILISNVQEKKWRRLAGLLGGWWQHQSRMEMSCHANWLTTKVSCPQKGDLTLNQPCLMIGAILFPRITLCQLCLIMTLVAIESKGVLGACPFEVLQIISFSLDYWSIYWCHCSTIALSHVTLWSGWTSRAHLMYPVLSYQVVAPHHVHLLMNMAALMVGILRVEERGNVHASQAIDIDSRSKQQTFQTG